MICTTGKVFITRPGDKEIKEEKRMVVQHNLSAMNSNRQLGITN